MFLERLVAVQIRTVEEECGDIIGLRSEAGKGLDFV
jgi:hypothetical protein